MPGATARYAGRCAAAFVAEAVVELAEVVDVERRDGEPRARTLGARDSVWGGVVEATVWLSAPVSWSWRIRRLASSSSFCGVNDALLRRGGLAAGDDESSRERRASS